MLSSRLHRVQAELQSHRTWLNRFVARTEAFDGSTSSPAHRSFAQQHGLPRKPRPAPKQSAKGAPAVYSGSKKLRLEKPKAEGAQSSLPPTLVALRQAVQEYRITDIARLYRALKDKRILSKYDFRTIAQALHHCLRLEKRASLFEKRRENTDELVELAEELVKDVRKGTLVPEGKAHVHLISFFKESGVRDAGTRFWQWLEQQDDLYVNVDVYGAAIELLAVNGAPLVQLEELYQQALNRFPGNFAAYHLSPEAMVPDRDQLFRVGGIPITLLQGILTARLLRGDTRNAYLALDTVLRLYPDQAPARFFTLFLEERPLLEAYTVFAVACRAGILIPANQFRHFLTAVRNSSSVETPEKHSLALRAMLSSMYMYIGAGGSISQNAVNELVIALTQMLRLPGVADAETKQRQKLVDAVMELVRTTLKVFARYGARPGISAFNTIITNLGGYGHSRQTIDVALFDVKALGLVPTEVTRRSILNAAGMLEDRGYVTQAWRELVQARGDAQQYPDASDFHVLAKMCHLTSQIDFARDAFETLKEHVPTHSRDGIEMGLSDVDFYNQPDDTSASMDMTAVLEELEKISADLQIIDQRTEGRPTVQDFRDQSLPMTLLRIESQSALPESEMRKLYDEMSAEARTSPQPSTASTGNREVASEGTEISSTPNPTTIDPASTPAVTPTNIPFGTLRYENWKSINYLLERAESSDRIYHRAVDEAIAAGVMPPRRTLSLILGVDEMESYGLSDLDQKTEVLAEESARLAEQETALSAEEVRRRRGREAHISRLRGRLP